MEKRISHFHDFKVSGSWWFPEKPDFELLGVLSYSPKEDGYIWLTLYGDILDNSLRISIAATTKLILA